MIAFFADLSHQFQVAITQAMRNAQGPDAGAALALLLGFAFLYGVFHTVLPGHQKTIVSAYFLSENARYGQGLLAGGLFAILHSVVAIGGLVVARFVIGLTAGQSLAQITEWTQRLSAWGLMAFGGLLFALKMGGLGEVKRVAELERVRRTLGFDLHDRLQTSYEPVPWRRFLPFLVFTALVPCPGAVLVLFFSVGLGSMGLGIAAVLVISLGMAATLTALSIWIIWMKKRGRKLTTRAPGRATVFALEALSLAVMVAFALLLLPSPAVRA